MNNNFYAPVTINIELCNCNQEKSKAEQLTKALEKAFGCDFIAEEKQEEPETKTCPLLDKAKDKCPYLNDKTSEELKESFDKCPYFTKSIHEAMSKCPALVDYKGTCPYLNEKKPEASKTCPFLTKCPAFAKCPYMNNNDEVDLLGLHKK